MSAGDPALGIIPGRRRAAWRRGWWVAVVSSIADGSGTAAFAAVGRSFRGGHSGKSAARAIGADGLRLWSGTIDDRAKRGSPAGGPARQVRKQLA